MKGSYLRSSENPIRLSKRQIIGSSAGSNGSSGLSASGGLVPTPSTLSTCQPAVRKPGVNHAFRKSSSWSPARTAVNMSAASTGERGEFAREILGSKTNRGGSDCPPRLSSSKWRMTRNCQKAWPVWVFRLPALRRRPQPNRGWKLVRRNDGSPAWIRTTIHGSKGRCPTIRRPGNLLRNDSRPV